MQELTPETITQAVLDQMASTPNPRMKQIMASAVKHLHAFAKDVNLTPAEWIKGIAFMTAVGKICTPARQEFILLSDTLGLSALVNGLHDETAMEEGTNTSLLGPFYRETTPNLAAGSQIAKNADPSTEIILYGRVTDVNGKPLAGATVSLWQTSATGLYDIQEDPTSVDYRGIFTTDANGLFLVRTVKPLGYSIPMDGPVGEMVKAQNRHGFRPSHIHFLIGGDGYRELVTALYFGDDVHIDSDTVFGVSGSLVVSAKDDPASPVPGLKAVRYDFRLAHAQPGDTGRVGADPSKLMKAAE